MTSIARNSAVINSKPRNNSILTNKPREAGVSGETTIFLETRTINKGQPIPWGLNWLMTYPAQLLNFSATRI